MKKLKPQISILLLIIVFTYSCSKKNDELQFPTCEITSPSSGDEFIQGEIVTVMVEASDPDGSIKKADFNINNVRLYVSETPPPYVWNWNTTNYEPGIYNIRVIVYDDADLEGEQTINVTIIAN